MTVRGTPAPQRYQPAQYWEERARQFAVEGNGLAAVCAYGMPDVYNWAIHLEQLKALAPWLDLAAGARVLDVGCGIGRWSRMLAARGGQVTGIDLSPTMIVQARRRAVQDGVAERCEFFVQDLAALHVAERYDMVLGVTVLQHILDPAALRTALGALHAHLKPGGRLILLEAAPSGRNQRCDSSVFSARPREVYLRLFAQCGFELEALRGVDPAPLRRWLLPYMRTLPRSVARGLVWLTTAVSLPINLLLGSHAVQQSWHAVFVLRKNHMDGADGCA